MGGRGRWQNDYKGGRGHGARVIARDVSLSLLRVRLSLEHSLEGEGLSFVDLKGGKGGGRE